MIPQLDEIVEEVAQKLRTEPLLYPDAMPLRMIRRKLEKADITVMGDRLSMIGKLLIMPIKGLSFCDFLMMLNYMIDS